MIRDIDWKLEDRCGKESVSVEYIYIYFYKYCIALHNCIPGPVTEVDRDRKNIKSRRE